VHAVQQQLMSYQRWPLLRHCCCTNVIGHAALFSLRADAQLPPAVNASSATQLLSSVIQTFKCGPDSCAHLLNELVNALIQQASHPELVDVEHSRVHIVEHHGVAQLVVRLPVERIVALQETWQVGC
jgi:hypothetical protein